MPREIPNLKERFAGCILGQAVGDALGLPWEGCSPEEVAASESSLLEDFPSQRQTRSGKGQYSDDTQMARATLESIVELRRVDPADVARRFMQLWESDEIVGQGIACREAVMRLISGAADWRSSGSPVGRAGNGSAMRMAPVGLFLFRDAEALRAASADLTRITHKDTRCVAGSTAVAAGVAWCLTNDTMHPEELVRHLVDVTGPIHPEFARLIGRLPEWLGHPASEVLPEIALAGRRKNEKPDWPGISPYVIPTVLAAFFAFLRTPDDYRQTVRTTLLAGGDTDTTAAIAGAISGAWNGAESVPRELAERVHDHGAKGFSYLRGLADSLHRIVTTSA